MGFIFLIFFKLFSTCKLISFQTFPDLDDNTGVIKKNFFYDNLWILSFSSNKMNGGITLGQFVFLSTNMTDIFYLRHEGGGHGKQSLCLGPFYLIVVGLSSLLHATFHKCKDYYHFWTEKWANEKGDTKFKNERK